MAAKDAKDPKDAAPAPASDKEKGATGAAPAEEGRTAAAAGLVKALLPALVALVVAPAVTFAVAEFVLLPRLQKKLAAIAPPAGAHAAAPAAEGESDAPAPADDAAAKGAKDKDGKDAGVPGTYEFSNVVVNLAGTMGTRYLKTSFIVTGVQGKSVRASFDGNKARLTDITLNVLSSLTLSDLEEPGSKNVLREKLVAAYNQALGKRLVDQVYFSDFVIQ